MYLRDTFRRITSYEAARKFIEDFFASVALLDHSEEDIAMNNAEFLTNYYLPRMREHGLELHENVAVELENKCINITWKNGDPCRDC